jgi:hypothetical protein
VAPTRPGEYRLQLLCGAAEPGAEPGAEAGAEACGPSGGFEFLLAYGVKVLDPAQVLAALLAKEEA